MLQRLPNTDGLAKPGKIAAKHRNEAIQWDKFRKEGLLGLACLISLQEIGQVFFFGTGIPDLV